MSKQQNFVPLSSKENPHLTVAVSLKGHQRTFAYWNPKRGVYVANNNRLDALQRSIQLNGETPVPPPGGFHKDGYVLYGDKNAPMNTPAATTQESDENAGGMSESTKVLSAGERLSSVAAKLARTVMRMFRTAEKQRAEENAQLQEQLGVHAEAHDKKNQERATSVKALIEATGSGLSSEIAANELLAAGRQVELLTAQQRTYDQIEFNRLKCEDQRLKDQKAADEKEEEDEAQRLKERQEDDAAMCSRVAVDCSPPCVGSEQSASTSPPLRSHLTTFCSWPRLADSSVSTGSEAGELSAGSPASGGAAVEAAAGCGGAACCRMSSAVAVWPSDSAHCRAVRPPLLSSSVLALARSRAFTHASCPRSAAFIRAEQPSSSCRSMLAECCRRTSRT